jgi:hypothetical protein
MVTVRVMDEMDGVDGCAGIASILLSISDNHTCRAHDVILCPQLPCDITVSARLPLGVHLYILF